MSRHVRVSHLIGASDSLVINGALYNIFTYLLTYLLTFFEN